MKKILQLIILLVVFINVNAQQQNVLSKTFTATEWYKYKYYVPISDSFMLTHKKYVDSMITAAVISGGGVVNVSSGYGLLGGPITSSGTLLVDTFKLATRSWRQKGDDSLSALIGTKGTVSTVSTGYGLSGGPITNTGTLIADSFSLATRAWRKKGDDSLGAIIATKGTVNSVASGYGILGGPITVAGTLRIDTADIATKLFTQQIINDTSSALRSWVQTLQPDTNVLSTRAWRQKGIDSLVSNATNVYTTNGTFPNATTRTATLSATSQFRIVSNSNDNTDSRKITFSTGTGGAFPGFKGSVLELYNAPEAQMSLQSQTASDKYAGMTIRATVSDPQQTLVALSAVHGSSSNSFSMRNDSTSVSKKIRYPDNVYIYGAFSPQTLVPKWYVDSVGANSTNNLTFSNGLTRNGNAVTLGGTLSQARTEIIGINQSVVFTDTLATRKPFRIFRNVGNSPNSLDIGMGPVNDSSSVFIGWNTGRTPSSGNRTNTVIGQYAGSDLTTGSSNTIIGATAGDSLTTGAANTAVGLGAINRAKTSAVSYANAFGVSALRAMQNGIENVGFGDFTLLEATVGSGNIFVGSNAGQRLDSTDENTVIGRNTMANVNRRSVNNVIIGAQAGSNIIESGDDAWVTRNNSVVIGHRAAGNANNLDSSIVIGTSALQRKKLGMVATLAIDNKEDSLTTFIIGDMTRDTIRFNSAVSISTVDSTSAPQNMLAITQEGRIVKSAVPSGGGGGGSGTVTQVNTGFGAVGGPITTTGTVSIDSFSIATRARVQKGIDSLGDVKQGNIILTTTGTSGAATLIGNTLNIPNYATGGGGSGTVTQVNTGFGITGGPITTTGTLAADSFSMATRARVQKGIDSLKSVVSTINGVFSSKASITPETNYNAAYVKTDVSYELSNNVLKMGNANDDSHRTITINAMFYVDQSNFSVGLWNLVGTIPASHRPSGMVNFTGPNYIPLTGNSSTTPVRASDNSTGITASSGFEAGNTSWYIDPSNGGLYVKINSITQYGNRGGVSTVVLPIVVTYFKNLN
jgi:hypothetical protein